MLQATGGAARFISDDGYLVGPRETVFAVFRAFDQAVREECGLTLQVTKCELYSCDGILPPDCPSGLKRAGAMVDGQFEPGFLAVGVPVGSDSYVKHMLSQKLEALEGEVDRAIRLLGDKRHALWTILRSSTLHKLEYWLGCVYPSLMAEAASRMDKLLWRMLEVTAGTEIPQVAPEQRLGGALPRWAGFETVLNPPVQGLQGKSFQWWVAQLPVKLGGVGLRQQSYLSLVAFLGSVEACVPSFGGVQGICENLAHLVGEEESDATRWAPLLASGSRLGEEFGRAWEKVKREAEQCCEFLGEEVPEILATTAAGFGLGAEMGSRQKVVEARESLLAAVLGKALHQYPDQSLNAIKAWKNRDKISTAFLLELPGPHNQWSSAEWGEAICLVLSIPPNCCKDPRHLGQPIGDRHVDLWGADVLCARLPGGSWTRRHDRIKACLSSLAVYCGVTFVCEPYSLFSAHLPQRPLRRLQAHQARQALRPDFLFHLPSAWSKVLLTSRLHLLATSPFTSQG